MTFLDFLFQVSFQHKSLHDSVTVFPLNPQTPLPYRFGVPYRVMGYPLSSRSIPSLVSDLVPLSFLSHLSCGLTSTLKIISLSRLDPLERSSLGPLVYTIGEVRGREIKDDHEGDQFGLVYGLSFPRELTSGITGRSVQFPPLSGSYSTLPFAS